MAVLIRSLLAIVVFLSLTTAITASGKGVYTIDGKIRHSRFEGLDGNRLPQSVPLKTSNVKVVLNSGQQVAFIKPDGYFAFTGIPAGTYLLEVVSPGHFFSPVRVDVSARLNGQLQATLTETRRILSEPLVLEPLREEAYFEKREPFSLMGLLKSPMGLMVGFMALAVLVLPKLIENIDPEEMKQMQDEMRNQPTPSLTNFFQGRSS